MRVGIFTECYEPVQNGVSTSVRTLVDELRGRHHHAFVVAPRFPNHEDGSPFVLRVPSIVTPFNDFYPVPYPWFPRLSRQFRRIAPNVLHSHSPFFVGHLASRLARQEDIPLVSTYHTLYNHYGHYVFFLPDQAIQGLLRWWMPEYYNRCAYVIAPSRVAEQSLRQYGVTTPVEIVPTGVPLPSAEARSEAARAAARARWSIAPDDLLLLYVGRIAREKNVEMVLDAFESAADDHPRARLLVVGGGPHLEDCRARAAAMRHGERVAFAGPVPRDELDPVYAAADLFVFASTTETQGLVVAEARAAGTPCVVVDQGGASETVLHGEDGLVVPPDGRQFAQAVRSLLASPDRLAALAEGCLRNAPRHTPGAMCDRIVSVYERAVEAWHSRTPVTA